MIIEGDVIFCNFWPHVDKIDNKYLLSELEKGKYRKVFINAVQEVRVDTWLETFGGTKLEFDRCLGEHNIEMMILYGGCSHSTTISKDPTVNTSIVNYPLFFAYDVLIKERLDYTLNEEVPNEHIQYLFSMLNNRKRLNRRIAIDRLARKDLLKHSIYSWQSDDKESDYDFKYFDDKPNTIDHEFDKQGYGSKVPFTVFESAFQIIGESFGYDFNSLFYTEKTFLGILRNRPFMLIGNPGLNDSLTAFGFKNYIDDIPGLREYEDEWRNERPIPWEYNIWVEEHTEYISMFTDIVANFLEQYKEQPQALFDLLEEKVTFNRKRYKEIVDNNLFSIPNAVKNFLDDTPFEASNEQLGHLK